MVNDISILTKNNEVIPKKAFEENIKAHLDTFDSEKREIYFGRTLSFLNLLPFNNDVSFDYAKLENMLDIKRVFYAQKQNNLAITNWLASLGLKHFFGVRKSLKTISQEDASKNSFAVTPLLTKYALFKHVLNKKFFSRKTLAYFDLPGEKKHKDKFYHLVNTAKTVADGLKSIQFHFSGNNKLSDNLVARLKNERINLKLYRPMELSRRPQDNYFLIVKEKEPISIAEKISLNLAELDLVSQQVPSFDLGAASIKDYFGFSINTQEFIDPLNFTAYERSTINALKQFYSNHEHVQYRYQSEKDNFYRGNKREMKGIQMYLAPNELATAKGNLKLPFPEVAGDPIHFKNIFPISFHAQGAKAYVEAQIGGHGIKPHMQYKDEERTKVRNFIKDLSSQLKKSYVRNLRLLEEINDMQELYVAFQIDNNA